MLTCENDWSKKLRRGHKLLQVIFFETASFLEKMIVQCSEDNLSVLIFLRRQLSTALVLEKTIVHCLIFREDNCPLLRRQLSTAKKTIVRWQFGSAHLQKRQSYLRRHFYHCSVRMNNFQKLNKIRSLLSVHPRWQELWKILF